MWGISVRPAARSRPCPEALPQCIVTRRAAPPSHGEKLHRHTAKSSTVTRRSAPPSHGDPSMHPSTHDVTAGLWPVSTAVAGGPRTTSSHGYGLYRHTAADNIVTCCAHISSHGVICCADISSHAAPIYRHMVQNDTKKKIARKLP